MNTNQATSLATSSMEVSLPDLAMIPIFLGVPDNKHSIPYRQMALEVCGMRLLIQTADRMSFRVHEMDRRGVSADK
jgi:hypothetical protein